MNSRLNVVDSLQTANALKKLREADQTVQQQTQTTPQTATQQPAQSSAQPK